MKYLLKGGSLAALAATSLASVAYADQVFVDDVIVQSSLCVGVDCINGETFNFDTIRIKENNLRVHFDDTSASASFPANDWRIIVNSSDNGGASFFNIEDSTAGRTPFSIEAGAAANALVVNSDGQIGLGTNNPIVELHVVDGDTPTLRLDQDGSSGFGSQTWDVAGNETNFFIRDVNNGSALTLRLRAGAPANSIYVDSDGDVGLGTQSPAGPLHVTSTAPVVIDSDGNLGVGTTTPGNPLHIVRATGAAEQFILMENNGPSAIVFDNNAATDPADWRMGQSSNSTDFLIVTPDSAGPELALTLTGDLEINGNYFSNGTQLAVPDYVFADDYELMSLDEVEAFIGQNNHLPHIPSAAEIAENGVNLSQMQMDLLKTVEELTLHTLAQQEALEAQAAEIAELRARLEN